MTITKYNFSTYHHFSESLLIIYEKYTANKFVNTQKKNINSIIEQKIHKLVNQVILLKK